MQTTSYLLDVTLLSRLWLLYSKSSRVGSVFTYGGRGLKSGPHRVASPLDPMNLKGMSSISVYASLETLPVHTKLSPKQNARQRQCLKKEERGMAV